MLILSYQTLKIYNYSTIYILTALIWNRFRFFFEINACAITNVSEPCICTINNLNFEGNLYILTFQVK